MPDAVTVIPRGDLDQMRCGTLGCTCATVHMACTGCGAEEFAVSYARDLGLFVFSCATCLTSQAVRVAGEA